MLKYISYTEGSEAELPARAEEVHHAKEEGIIFDLLTNPKEILVDENGHVKGMKVVKMELGEPDASGRRRPVEIPGSEYDMDVDTVIMSLGTSPNPLISLQQKVLKSIREDVSLLKKKQVRHLKMVYMPAVMLLQVQLLLSLPWVQVKLVPKVSMNILKINNVNGT